MACSSCQKKRERFRKLMEQKKRELQALSGNKDEGDTPLQKRIRERNKRIAERNKGIQAKLKKEA